MNKAMKIALSNKFDLNQFFTEKPDMIDWYFALNELILNPVFNGRKTGSKHVRLSWLIFDTDFIDRLLYSMKKNISLKNPLCSQLHYKIPDDKFKKILSCYNSNRKDLNCDSSCEYVKGSTHKIREQLANMNTEQRVEYIKKLI